MGIGKPGSGPPDFGPSPWMAIVLALALYGIALSPLLR